MEAEVKAWGNSAGILIPKEKQEELDLEIGDTVSVTIEKEPVLKRVSGVLADVKPSTDKSTDELLAEADKGWER